MVFKGQFSKKEKGYDTKIFKCKQLEKEVKKTYREKKVKGERKKPKGKRISKKKIIFLNN